MTDWGSIADWTGALAQVGAAIATVVVIYQARKTIEISERSENIQTFMNFSDRYDLIKRKIPRSFIVYWPNLDEALKSPSINNPQAIEDVLDLFDLFDKQHFLYQKGFVDQDLWEKVWLNGIKKNLAIPSLHYVFLKRDSYDTEGKISVRFVKFLKSQKIRTEI